MITPTEGEGELGRGRGPPNAHHMEDSGGRGEARYAADMTAPPTTTDVSEFGNRPVLSPEMMGINSLVGMCVRHKPSPPAVINGE